MISTILLFAALSSFGQWEYTNLSEPNAQMGVTVLDSKVCFAGGFTWATGVEDNVEIYNVETGEWTKTYLSQPRGSMGSAVVGNLAIFAGGNDNQLTSDRVDIFLLPFNHWASRLAKVPPPQAAGN